MYKASDMPWFVWLNNKSTNEAKVLRRQIELAQKRGCNMQFSA